MYFGVSNSRYKSSQLTGRGRGPSPLSSGIKQNASGMFNLWAFLFEGIQRGLGVDGGARAEVLKSGFPKIPSTQSFCKEKSSYSLQIFPRKPLSCPSRGRIERGKKNALQERWGSDKGRNKKGVGYCVQVSGSHWSARRDPLRGRDPSFVPFGLGTEAAAALGWGPVPESSYLCLAGRCRRAVSEPASA